MNRRKILPLLLTLALALLTTACGALAAAPESADRLELEAGTVLKGSAATEEARWNYEIATYTVTGEHHANDDPETMLIRHSYQVPRMKVSAPEEGGWNESREAANAAANAFNSFFEEKLRDEVAWFEEMAAIAEENYTDWSGDADSPWLQEGYCFCDETTLEFWTGGSLVCVTTTNYSYTGGAHPTVWRSAVNFDLRTGRAVALADLTNNVERLQAAVEKELLRQAAERCVAPDKPEEGKVSYFEDYAETLKDWMERSTAFDETGMQVIFGVYDIAPYAAGEQVFTIPYRILAPHLNSYGRTLLGLK